MRNLRRKLSYTLYFVLAVVFLTSCSDKDKAIVEKVTFNAENDGAKYFVKTTEWGFVTDSIYNVGDTLIICRK